MADHPYTKNDLWDYTFGMCDDETERAIRQELESGQGEARAALDEIARTIEHPFDVPLAKLLPEAAAAEEHSVEIPFRRETIELLEASLVDDDQQSRGLLKNLIRHQLETLIRLRTELSATGAISKRGAVNAISFQLFGKQELQREQMLHFVQLAADVLREANRASADFIASGGASTVDDATLTLTSEETIEVFSADEETVHNMPVPARTLARERALVRLESEGQRSDAANTYLLHFFTGRTTEEIAQLQDRPTEAVAKQLKVAMTFVDFTIRQELEGSQ